MAASPKCKECIRCLDENVACKYEVICEPLTKAELFIPVFNSDHDEEASEARMDTIGSNGNDGLHYGLTSQEVLANLDDAIAKSQGPLDIQYGGGHYKKMGMYQPWEVMKAWLTREELKGAAKKEAITYLAREADKGGRQDIEKAMHTLQIYLELTKND